MAETKQLSIFEPRARYDCDWYPIVRFSQYRNRVEIRYPDGSTRWLPTRCVKLEDENDEQD